MSPGTDNYAALEWLTARKITRFKSEITGKESVVEIILQPLWLPILRYTETL